MRILFCFTVALVVFGCVGCAGFMQAPVVPPLGFFYTNFQSPLDVDYAGSDTSGKMGTACSVNVLGLVAVGDASAKAAAAEGGITSIEHADYKFTSVLGVYSRYTTIVYGR